MKGKKKTGQNILHYVIASSVVIVFIIAILGGYLFRFYYKKMQEDFYKENSVYVGNIAKTHGNELQILQDISMQIDRTILVQLLFQRSTFCRLLI